MPLYTFFCCKADGSAPTFESHRLPSDEAAVAYSEALLKRQGSCSHVLVCEGDRDVATRGRKDASPPKVKPPVHREPQLAAPVREALSDAAVEATGAAVMATTHDGAVVYWNQAATRLYGWAADEALGRNVMQLTPSLQSREEAETIMRGLQQGETWDGEIVLRRRDGTPFRAFVANLPFEGPGGERLIIGASAAAARRRAVRAAMPLLAEKLDAEPAPAATGSPR